MGKRTTKSQRREDRSRSRRGAAGGRRVGTALAAFLVACALSVTGAAAVEFNCPGNACCLGDFTPNANCTSNDLTFVLVGLGVTDDGCTSPTDDISILLRAIIDNQTAQTRYDVGMWVATDGDPNGDGAFTGVCAREILTPPSGVLDSVSCTDLDLTCGAGPFYDADLDSCGDVLDVTPDCGQNDDITIATDGPCTATDGLQDDAVMDFPQPVTFPCTDSDADGFVNLDVCMSFANNSNQVDFGGNNNDCDDASEIEPGTNAKCRCEDDFNTNIPVPDLGLSCSCAGATIPGGFTECTLSYTNTDLAGCTPDPGTIEQYRCGTAAYMRFDLDYDETNLSVANLSTMDGTAADSGALVTWDPESANGTANILGEGESGSLTVRFDVDADAPTGTYTNTATAVWSLDAAFTTPVPQTLTADCDVVVGATWALVSELEAYDSTAGVVVEWRTAGEGDVLGFHLERLDPERGGWQRLTERPLPAVHHGAGGVYRFVDADVDVDSDPAAPLDYRLVEVDARGGEQLYGPYTVTVADDGPAVAGGFERRPRTPEPAFLDRLAAAAAEAGAGEEGAGGTLSPAAQRLRRRAKVGVVEPGLYAVDAATLADALGRPESKVRELIAARQLRLHRRGGEVRWQPVGDAALRFVGRGIDPDGAEALYTEEDVYWIEVGAGAEIKPIVGAGPPPVAEPRSFAAEIHLEEDLLPRLLVATDPEDDYWFWDFVIAGHPDFDRRTFDFELPGVAEVAEGAAVTLRLWGFNAGPHLAEVRLGGTVVGEVSWQGKGPHAAHLAVDPGLLRPGTNTLELDGGEGVFFVDSFDLRYPRWYRADGGALRFRGDGHEVVTVTGFATPEVAVYDLTEPDAPRRVEAVTVDREVGGDYRVSLRPASPETPYLAVSEASVRAPASVRGRPFPGLRSAARRGEYLAIAPAGLADGARVLADYRAAQGLESQVVELEEVFDELAHGVRSPEAVRDFLAWAAANWQLPPRYVVLVGRGHYDYRNLLGLGGNPMPPLFTATPFGLFPSDARLADLGVGDGVPRVAVGRLPVLTAAELEAYVGKVMAYEASGGAWPERLMFLADDPDSAGDFTADSTLLASRAPAGFEVEATHLHDPYNLSQARQRILGGFDQGALVVSYLGHGGIDRLAAEGMMLSSDVAGLANGERLPVVMGMSCYLGFFAFPELPGIGEELVLHPEGGAAAVWASSALTANRDSRQLGEQLLDQLLTEREPLLGDAVLDAVQGYLDAGGYPGIVPLYNLLGDPALRIRYPF